MNLSIKGNSCAGIAAAVAVCIVLLFACSGIAQASTATWTDVWDPNPDVLLNSSNSYYSYTHDITDNGFDVGQDLVTSYDLAIGLYDDSNDDGCEWVWVSPPGWISDGIFEVDHEDIERGWSFKGLFALNTTGRLDVDIIRLWGDFYFDKSTLNAHGCDANPVPIPSTLLLFGSAIVGTFFTFYTNTKKKGII